MKGEIIKEHDRVVLKVDLPAEGLKAGDVGTVVHLYRDGLAYEVEFTTLSGDTAAVVTVQKSQSAFGSQTRNHARQRIAGRVTARRALFSCCQKARHQPPHASPQD